MIGIIGAMTVEVERLQSLMTEKKVDNISGMSFYSGKINGKEVVVTGCGIGKVFAAICAQTMILRYNIDCLINTGVAGSLSDELDIFDTVVSSGVVQHDMDTSPIGDPVGLISGINKIEIEADARLIALADKAAEKLNIKYMNGVVASGDQFIATDAQRKRIFEHFSPLCCEMEGAAIGHVAYVNNVPFVVIRAISDGASKDSSMDFPTFCARAAENSASITLELIKDY